MTSITGSQQSKGDMRGIYSINLMPSATGRSPLPDRPAFGAVWPNDASVLGDPSRDLTAR